MPFCHQCGATNPDSARFCDQCGVELISVLAQSNPPAPVPFPVPPVNASMPNVADTCPQCGMAVIPGEAFCDHCGAPLLKPATPAPVPVAGGVPPQVHYPPPQPVGTPPLPVPPVSPPAPLKPSAPVHTTLAGGQLLLQGGSVTLPLPAATQALIGRADAVSQFFPDIDLAAYGGLEHGVGRRHLRLFVQNGQVYVEDLDSTNGSFLNGQKLAAQHAQPVHNGDELRLGRLVLHLQI